jgi:glycosyltransferase involved in cell wall biosynthesis
MRRIHLKEYRNIDTLPNDKNNERLYELRDIHKGRRAFIIGDDPGVPIEDLEKLRDEITLASNRIFLLFSRTGWRPTYYTLTDHRVASNNKDNINSLRLKKIFSGKIGGQFKGRKDVIFVNSPPDQGEENYHLVKGVRAGYSIINFNLKVAYWLGIREVYMIGVDFFHHEQSLLTGKIGKDIEVDISTGEENHFRPDWQKNGGSKTINRFDRQVDESLAIKKRYEAAGGKIYNASRQTKLDIWERIEFDQVIENSPGPTLVSRSQRVFIYCADISGHRHLYSAYVIRFYLQNGYTMFFCYAGKVSRIHSSGKMEYTPEESLYLERCREEKQVFFKNICYRLNNTYKQLDLIRSIQAEIQPLISVFIDGDILKWLFWRQMLPWQPRLVGRNFCIMCLSEFIYYPVKNKLKLLGELAVVFKKFFTDRLDLTASRYFVEKFPLMNRLFFWCLCRYNLVAGAFCPDEKLVEQYDHKRMIFLPELMVSNLEEKVDEKKSRFYKKIKEQYRNFLDEHKEKLVLLMFGDLEPRKGYDLLLKLAAHDSSCVCVRFGRTKQNYSPTRESIIDKEKLILEERLFELDVYLDSRELIDFIFSTVSFLILPYKKYDRTSGVMMDALRRGLPVLTHNRGVMANIVRQYNVGRVFKEGNFPSLAREFAIFKNRFESYRESINKFNIAFSKEASDKALSITFQP